MNTLYTDIKEEILQKYIFKKWQEYWGDHPHDILYIIQPKQEVRIHPPDNLKKKRSLWTVCV